jgi:GTP diphosphokinase / guanosine-3',5'-bis(diphosphate) 3'-diphosphatase
MVTIDWIKELRPRVVREYDASQFVPRTEMICNAYNWGQELHDGHKRLSGEPYFETHCVWVAGFLDTLVQNETYTIAGLLHDSVEDRQGTLESIRNRFPGKLGEDVAHIVDGVTKLGSPPEGQSREIEALRKLVIFRDPGVFLVKLADKTHNMLTLQYMSAEKRQKKATEAIRAYGRLAGTLNCYEWRRWLEDLAFPFADPETFDYVKSHIDSDPRLDVNFINETMYQLGKIMESCGAEGRINIIINGYWQAWQKLRRMALMRKTSLDGFSAINDLISFRMVVKSTQVDACYQLLARVNQYFGSALEQDRFDDYLASPQNGYRALQVTGWWNDLGAIEVAITTEEMEGENLWGVIYAMQHGKDISQYQPLVILTPTGSLRFVPDGSSVLDAVASIQNEFLMDKISIVQVNGRHVQLSDRIQAGDVVEVITGKERIIPSTKWLGYSNPTTARILRAVLATKSLKQQADLGRIGVKACLKKRGVLSLDDILYLEPDKMDQLLEETGCSSPEDLYTAVGGGAVRPSDLESALDKVGIFKKKLQWTSINLIGSSQDNQPGTLAALLKLISKHQGNILRAVNDTLPNGDFSVHMVVLNLSRQDEVDLVDEFQSCPIQIKFFEMV